MSNVIIVSNRLPVSVKKVDGQLEFSRSIGGLATGLSSYTAKQDSRWIGWPGIVSEELTEEDKQHITERLELDHCYPVFLTQKQVDEYYNGFSNSILWPFFHNLPTKLKNQEDFWQAYRKVNLIFAAAVTTHANPRSIIWVHDYQLMMLPEILRDTHSYANVGFFLHTPFPEADRFKELPHAKALLHGILGADLVGFHTPDYVEKFLEACYHLNVGSVSVNQVALPDHIVQVTDFPIGIDYTKYARAARLKPVRQKVRKLKRQFGRFKVILAFDRLDVTKGFVERLKAYRQLLEDSPQWHRKVVMIMIAAPSRTDLKAYQRLKKQIEKLVDEINDDFSTRGWKPVHYIFQSMNFDEVSAYYQIADIAFITPVKDGMNLMAKEYVASKRNKAGVLILSQTAGAANELDKALLVDPTKQVTLVDALSRALTMRPKELKFRLSNMQQYLARHTVQHWAKSFLHSLQHPGSSLQPPADKVDKGSRAIMLKAYRTAKKRLILLDYDGVLAEFRNHPKKAAPTPALHRRLQKLTDNKANQVVIISGRSRTDLEEWFGDLPVDLAAEHGALVKTDGEWRRRSNPVRAWRNLILPVLEKYAAKTPGAFVEVKETSLVWHYRQASPYYAQKNMVILRRILKPVLRSFGLGIFMGNRILEIKHADTNKGSALGRWLKTKPDFIMAIGDDYTDEDMFKALPPPAYTIKVGPGTTAARYRLASVDETINLLSHLT